MGKQAEQGKEVEVEEEEEEEAPAEEEEEAPAPPVSRTPWRRWHTLRAGDRRGREESG